MNHARALASAGLVCTLLVACASGTQPEGFGSGPHRGAGSSGGSGSSGGGSGGGSSSGSLVGDAGSTSSQCNPSSIDLEGCECSAGQSHGCYTGPASTRNVSPCHDGTQTCRTAEGSGQYGPCTGEQVPSGAASCGATPPDAGGCAPKACNSVDAQCGSIPDGCGGMVECGTCAAGETCGRSGSGQDNVCLPSLCENMTVNNEPEIVAGYEPGLGQKVAESGQIKVWVQDECPPYVSPGEQLDPNTGAITMPGDRTAMAPDGYLWEPALYISPQTAENGGTPHFPVTIKGNYDNNVTSVCGIFGGAGFVPGMDPPPPGSMITETNVAEFIWDVSSLSRPPGTYVAEFVIHDGDVDRGVGCIEIVITP